MQYVAIPNGFEVAELLPSVALILVVAIRPLAVLNFHITFIRK